MKFSFIPASFALIDIYNSIHIVLLCLFCYSQIGLIFGWVIFLLLAYKVSKIQMDYVEYDPFLELEVDRVGLKQHQKALTCNDVS